MNQIVKGGAATAKLTGNPAKSATVSARVLGEAGKAYAIYVRGGTSAQLTLDLPQGSYKAEWVNTKTGKVDKVEEIKGGTVNLSSPEYSEDIALSIRQGR